MSENILTVFITSVTGILAALISAGTQIIVELIKQRSNKKQRTFRLIIRSINWWITVLGTVIAVIIMVALLLMTMPKTREYSTTVSAGCPAFNTTGVVVEKGDDVEIIVQGEDPAWDCGRGLIGPEGYFGEKYQDHFSPSSNACALIGYVGQPQVYFHVGYYKQFKAADAGLLYLGVNDAKNQCNNNPAGPRFAVKIFVKK
jgi:hypothetical protein